MADVFAPIQYLRARLAALGEAGRGRFAILRRVPPLHVLLEMAARVGYGARGFVYVSIGVICLMAALDMTGDAVGSSGAVATISDQPFARSIRSRAGPGRSVSMRSRHLPTISRRCSTRCATASLP